MAGGLGGGATRFSALLGLQSAIQLGEVKPVLPAAVVLAPHRLVLLLGFVLAEFVALLAALGGHRCLLLDGLGLIFGADCDDVGQLGLDREQAQLHSKVVIGIAADADDLSGLVWKGLERNGVADLDLLHRRSSQHARALLRRGLLVRSGLIGLGITHLPAQARANTRTQKKKEYAYIDLKKKKEGTGKTRGRKQLSSSTLGTFWAALASAWLIKFDSSIVYGTTASRLSRIPRAVSVLACLRARSIFASSSCGLIWQRAGS